MIILCCLGAFAIGASEPKPIDTMPLPYKTLRKLAVVQFGKTNPWVRGVYALQWSLEGKMPFKSAYEQLWAEMRPGVAAPPNKDSFPIAFAGDLNGSIVFVSVAPGIARPKRTETGTIYETLEKDTMVTVGVTQTPTLDGPMPARWWKGAFSAEPPVALVPLPFGDKPLPASAELLRWGSGSPYYRGSYGFGLVIDRPYADVLIAAKKDLFAKGYVWRGTNYYLQGFVSTEREVYCVQISPFMSADRKEHRGRTQVRWFWLSAANRANLGLRTKDRATPGP